MQLSRFDRDNVEVVLGSYLADYNNICGSSPSPALRDRRAPGGPPHIPGTELPPLKGQAPRLQIRSENRLQDDYFQRFLGAWNVAS